MTKRTHTSIVSAPTTALQTFARSSGNAKALYSDQAIYEFVGWLTRMPDPDEVLRKSGLTRANLRAITYDDEIAQCLDTRMESVIAVPWRLEPQQTRLSKWLTEQITPHIEELIRCSFNAVLYGYSVCEVVYKPQDGRIGISHLGEKPLEWFEPKNDNSLIYRPQVGGEIVCDPLKYILSRHQPSYRQPYGEALLSRLYWPAYFRSHGRKFWAKFLERFGEPLIIGKVRDQEKFMSDVIALGLASGLPVQPEDSIEHIAATQAGEFERFEQAISKSIQKLILGQTLTSDVGASGSYAAAKVHEQVKETKRNADIRLISQTLQALVNNLCTLNAIAKPPEFVMADGTGLETDRANRDKTLVEAGILTLTEDYILDRYDFKEGDFTMPEPATEAPQAPSAPDAPDPQDQEDQEDPEAQPTSANMAASTAVRPRFTAGQQAIEDQIERTLSNFVSPITHKAIASAIAGATSPENLIERLGVAMQDSTDAQFRQTLERALFAADLMGYGQAQKQQA